MNEREQFEKHFQSALERTIARIQTMTEDQVVHELRSVKATRKAMDGELAFLQSVSMSPTDDLEDEIDRLRSDLNSYPRPAFKPTLISDYIEDALTKRLEMLRRRGR